MIHKTVVGSVAGAGLVATVVLANWLTSVFHFVPVGFGQQATAGSFAAGFALAARDVLQDLLGKKWMLVALGVASAVSYIVADPMIAVASAAAFALSELLDFGVYSPLRERSLFGDRRWATAVLASGLVGAVADTFVFVGLAFGAAAVMPAMLGQLIGKGWATATYAALGVVGRKVKTRSAVHGKPYGI